MSDTLTPIYGAVQGGHAIAQWMLEHHDNLTWKNETVVYLRCDVLKTLSQLAGEDVSIFREPDLGNEITAFALLGNEHNRRILKKLKVLQ